MIKIQKVNLKKTFLFLLKIFLLLNIAAIVKTEDCQETWEVLSLEKENWELIGDVQIIEKASSEILFYRDVNEKKLTGDIGGAAWYKINRNSMEGIKISFTPSITIDYNFYGNVKYPQGFAFIFMSNAVNNGIGEKRSGIGYDGLNNAVAFEFDFLQNSDKNDIRNPHFSAHYKLDGQISSASPPSCLNICNIQLPNFYDSQRPNYQKDIIFYIEIYGGKLYLKTENQNIINGIEFPHLDSLMEKKEVYFGITASMNPHKSISLKGLNLSKIQTAKIPELHLINPKESYEAGKSVQLSTKLRSKCGHPLRIFTEEFKKFFSLEVDYENWNKNIDVSFEDNQRTAILSLNQLTKAKTIIINQVWKDEEGTPIELEIGPGDRTYYDICDPDYDKETQFLKAKVTDTKEFTFSICSTDQYRNPKISKHLSDDELVRIGYPYLVPPITGIKIVAKENQTKFDITAPLTGYGDYTIYNEKFFNGPKKFFRISVLGIDLAKSYGEINSYVINKNTQVNKPVVLYVKAKDAYGTDLTIDQLNSLSCSLDNSKIQHRFKSETKFYDFVFIDGALPVVDGYAALTFNPEQPGEFTFLPKIRCGKSTESIDINCEPCTFFIESTVPDTTRFKLFSDYKNRYFISNEVNPLFISLDEATNKILTTLRIIDTSGVEIRQPSIEVSKIAAKITLRGNDVVPIDAIYTPAGIDLNVNSLSNRDQIFSPLESYFLSLKFSDANFQTSDDFNIPVRFAYKDRYLNNINKLSKEITLKNVVVTFIPETFTIRASSNRLLFRILARNSNFELTMGDSLDPQKVLVRAFDTKIGQNIDIPFKVYKSGYFLNVTGSFKKSGTYTIKVTYMYGVNYYMELTVTPRMISSLLFDRESSLVKSVLDNNVITLNDIEVDQTPSFLMQMVDEFENVIDHNYLEIFNQITIKNIGDVRVQSNINGVLVIIFSGRQAGNSQVSLELPNGKVYQVNWTKTSLKIDPTNSFAKLHGTSNVVGSSIKVILNVFDSFSSEITANINNNEDALQDFKKNSLVYLIGPSDSFTILTFEAYKQDGFYFTTEAGKDGTIAGEYQLKVYYKNVSIKCEVCFMELTPDVLKLSITSAYWVGANNSIQLYSEYYNFINIKDGFTIYLVFKDQFGNEVEYEGKYDLILRNEDESASTSPVRLCRIAQNLKKRQYFQLCSIDDQEAFSQLSPGNYEVKVDENIFKFRIALSQFEPNENQVAPSNKYSYILNDNNLVLGSIDIPARMIIDLRSINNLRYSNYDLSQIKITLTDYSKITDYSYKISQDPSNGLITVIISLKNSSIGKLSVSIGDNLIISDISYKISSGEINQMVYSDISYDYSKGRVHLFNVLDASQSGCNLHNNQNIINNLIMVSYKNGLIDKESDFNPLACTVSVKIDPKFSDELILDSKLLKSPATSKSLSRNICTDHSFAYLEDDTDAELNSKAIIRFEALDSYSNKISYDELKTKIDNLFLLVLLKNGKKAEYISAVLPQLDDESKSVFFLYDLIKSGDYTFIPLYDNIKIECTSCNKKVIAGYVNFDYINVQIKNGFTWNDKAKDIPYILFQNTFPLFKINFRDYSNTELNLVSLAEFSFTLSVDDNNQNVLDIEIYKTQKNGVFLYLTESGRKKYLDLKPFDKLKLTVQNKLDMTSSMVFQNFLILNAERDTPSNVKCQEDSVPIFTQLTNYSGYIEAGYDFIQEFYLEGCQSQEDVFFSESEFSVYNLKDNIDIQSKIIPADVVGNYLLILTSNKTTNDPLELRLKFKSSKESDKILFKVLPSSQIGKYVYSSAGNFYSSSDYAYFYITAYDQFDNLLTNDQISFLSSDFNLNIRDTQNKISFYRMSFDTSLNKFLIEVPVNSQGNLTINSKYSEEIYSLQINNSNSLKYSLITVTNQNIQNKQFEVKIELRDEFYLKYQNIDIQYINSFNFMYYTYNPLTNEEIQISLTDIKQKDPASDSNVLLISIPENIPIYKYAIILPFSSQNSLTCNSCLLISDQETKYNESNILIDKDSTPSTNEADASKSIIYSQNLIKFKAGKTKYFFLEARDSNNILTNKTPTLGLSNLDIKLNVIKSSVAGFYLIEISSYVKINPKLVQVHLNGKILSSNFSIEVESGFPISLELKSLKILNSNLVAYNVLALDSFQNNVCDEKINLSAKILNSFVPQKIAFDSTENSCVCYFNFAGIAVINSPLFFQEADINSTIQNFSDFHISSFESSLILDENNSRKNSPINFNFNLTSQNGLPYPTQLIKEGLSIKVYKILDFNSKILVKEIKNLSTQINSFTPDSLNISYGDYLISGVVDGVELKNLSPFRYYKSFVQDPTNINLKVKQGKKWESVNPLYDANSKTYSRMVISYPFSFMVSSSNSDDQLILINDDTKIEAKLLLDPITDTTFKLFDLEGVQYSETTYLFQISKDKVSDYLHLPKGNYIFVFSLKQGDSKLIEKWLPIEVKQGIFQNNNLNLPYALPGDSLDTTLEIVSSNNGDTINANVGNYSKTNLCIKSNGKIYNDYLEARKFVVNNLDFKNCSVITSTLLRGCIDIYVYCKNVAPTEEGYSIRATYNNISIQTPMHILIDPQLPPKNVALIEAFKNEIEQKSEITAQFNLLDDSGNNFKYLSQDNFEVFVNNKILEREKWIVWFNKNLNLKILNVDYPPRKQNIQVYFKDIYGFYTSLSELNLEIKVTQGNIDPRKSSISLPVSYYAGDPLKFVIILRDNFNNCFEDDINLDEIKLIGKLTDLNFDKFELTQTSINFPFCKRILSVKVDESPFKLVGSNKIDLLYQNKSINDATLSILPNKLSPEKSELTVVGAGIVPVAQVQAGVNLEILMKGTDAYSNKVSYYDLAQKSDIIIMDLEKNKDYFFYAYNNEISESISMNLVINKLGRYSLTYLINNEIFKNNNGLNDIIVTAGKCSSANPNFKVQSNLLYTADYGLVEINCLDDFNNSISVRGDENFHIEIKGHHLEIVDEDKVPYELIFNSGVYTAKFLLAYKGEYLGQIYLNGNLYGNSFVLNVQSRKCPTDTPVMCSNRKCVKNISDCSDDIDSYNCQNPENPFFCKVNGESTCVSKLSECDCSSGFNKCNGMCIPKDMANICSKPINTNCQRKLPFFKDPLSCPDGSCRTNSRCPNPMGCPIGYKPCGSKCILRKTQCKVETPKCTSSQVVCWDLSCADSLDTCPTAKSCNNPNSFVCPDGKCVSDVTQCTQPPQCNSPFNYLCPDFSCKKSAEDCNQKSFCYVGQSLCENNICADDCSKISSCPADKYLCPNGQCVENYLLCPTSLSCPAGTIKCPSGSCATDYEECKFTSSPSLSTLKSCPLTLPILCPDLSCASNISDCKTIPSCPADKPYRCGNNECRESRSNCPSITTCPGNFPVLCEDGSCQKASYHCSDRSSDKCDGYKCWNGSCVSSISLCPNEVSCGFNHIKCWDGACVNDIQECRDPKYIKCPDERPFRCADGSCRVDKKSCSTVSICPSERPVKCYDNSCKENINLCPAFQPCGKNMISCPDGTCASDKCNTIVTCPETMPFLCYDNTCAIDIRDCPTPTKCDGVFCPDGSCVSNRLLCKFFEPCSSNNPVRCQHGSCAASVEDCYSILRECPIGYVKCKTGGCKINESMCREYNCPKNLPYLCSEGICSISKEYCDDTTTGCPFNKKYKCIDGSCVKNINECMKYSQASCPKNSLLCPDGSCRQSFYDCPLQNGCPKDKPLKCADGICVDPSRTQCSIPSCPFNLPIQCPSGECVATTSNCPSTVREQDFKDCKDEGYDDHFMCADGRCVPTPDFCRPLYKCPDGYTKCSDGTCKLSSNQCQSSSNCPSNRPARCPFGKCVTKESDCFTTIFCPSDFPILCEKNKECVRDVSECPKKINFANGCPAETPFKCLDGRCLANSTQCKLVNIACNVDYPVLCADGSCKKDRESCVGVRDACPNNYTRCPDGTCEEERSFMLSCKNKIGCPLVKPIRCSDGSCAANESECKSSISCPSDFPVLCADLSCAAHAKFCKVLYPCKDNFKRCKNGFCVKYENECEAISDICPLSSPVKCSTGKCAKSISECSAEFSVDECKEKNQIFCTRTSECVNTVAECVGSNYAAGTRPGTSRLLQQIKDNNKVNPENHCFSEAPYSCYDGTCRKTREECPVLAACGIMEYRCSNGACQKDPQKCNENSVVCEPGLNKCEDGLCRAECPPYNGCGLATPFQCTNGMCVKNLLECIGYSMCENSDNPFRCVDGTCVSDPRKCPDIKRLNSPAKQTVSISTLNNIDVSFAYDRFNRNIGRLYLPANSLRSAPINPTNYTTITIEEVPHSLLYQYYIKYNNTNVLLYDISNGILGSDGVLDFENSVYSSIVNISGSNVNKNFSYPGIIYLENNYLAQGQFKTNDYCLAKLENNQWNCLERKTSNDQSNFIISSLGIYAVVLNPLRPPITLDQSVSGGNNFFFENLKVILIVLGSLFFSIVIISYVFSRVIRYREKYQENKEKLVNMKNQMQEYKNMSTDIPGQTLGDTIAGIVFQRNPAHSVITNTKGMVNATEYEIEELQRKCKTLETQNRSIEERIEDVNEEYKMLKQEIERIKRKLKKN